MCDLWIKCLSLWMLLKRVDVDSLRQTKSPIFSNHPFLVFWNAPTEQCQLRYKVNLHLKVFGIVPNPNDTLNGPFVTIFYPNQMGVYPHLDDHGKPFHGVIPQNESLTGHLIKAKSDIDRIIPKKTFRGLGVIDWENWRPQWNRNWGNKNVYRLRSIDFARASHPGLPEGKLKKMAMDEYETAAKSFMAKTLLLAEHMRPGGYWGYYLYPDCYNYDYKKNPDQYTGECPNLEMSRNDELSWLWKESTALFPSIYLEVILRSSANALKFVHYRLKESMRVATMARNDYVLPVYVYARPFYAYTFEALTEEDLVATVGESAAMGAAGIIFWGSSEYARTTDSCNKVKNYVSDTLGHYITNVTYAAKLCSNLRCKRNGRCIRKNSDSNAFLHLSPESFRIMVQANNTYEKVIVKGKLRLKEWKFFKSDFMCQCYEGWSGEFCEKRSV